MDELELTLGIIKYGAIGGFTILMAYLTWIARNVELLKKLNQKQALFGMSHKKDIAVLMDDKKELEEYKKELEKWQRTIERELSNIKNQLAKKGK